MTNKTVVTMFILLGFQASQHIRIMIFILLFVVYCFTIIMNLLIITLVSTSKILQTPMYFFISQLSINDIMLATDIVPKMLHIILYYRGSITFIGCMTQLYFFGASEGYECLLLTVMSYDRYVAICNPLRYTSIITELSCSNAQNIHVEMSILGVPLVLIPIIVIIFSYTKIIATTLKIPSSTGRQKAFSTCSSHLIVVSIFYGTIFGVYVLPTKGQSSTLTIDTMKKVDNTEEYIQKTMVAASVSLGQV
ncbi:olfactory receptor 10A7-like [Leptodactylus fuscus]